MVNKCAVSECRAATVLVSKGKWLHLFIQEDELESFLKNDNVRTLSDLNKNVIEFDEETQFPIVHKLIRINEDLYAQLHYNGISIPLPQCLSRDIVGEA